jgi:hypothetical protein
MLAGIVQRCTGLLRKMAVSSVKEKGVVAINV